MSWAPISGNNHSVGFLDLSLRKSPSLRGDFRSAV
jgi:hypothetical protein